MVLDIIVITGVAAAMLGWNVHVMRENGVSSPISCFRREPELAVTTPVPTESTKLQMLRVKTSSTKGTQTLLPEVHPPTIHTLGAMTLDTRLENADAHTPTYRSELPFSGRTRCHHLAAAVEIKIPIQILIRSCSLDYSSISCGVLPTQTPDDTDTRLVLSLGEGGRKAPYEVERVVCR